MKKHKRFLALALALVMALALLPTAALGAEEDFVIQDGKLTLYHGPGGEVVIPEGVTSIGSCAFLMCENLTSVTLPSTLTSIGSSAFYGCSSLASINIPDGVTTIGNSAFSGCSSWKNAHIPSGITAIDKDTFYGCASLTDVTIPSTVTSIGQSAFEGCAGLTDIVIPRSVTTFGIDVFKDCAGLTRFTIPDNMTAIPEGLFKGCSGLTAIDIPNWVTSVGKDAFSGCSGAKSITIPDSVTELGAMAFANCSGVEHITLPDSVTTISYGLLAGCSSLESVTIPSTVTSMDAAAFHSCTSLKSITLPAGLTTISDTAFYDCKSLKSITIPAGVTTIGDSAFDGCSRLKSVAVPEGVTSLGHWVFEECTGLKSVTLPASLTFMDKEVFKGCDSLERIDVAPGNPNYCSVDGILFSKDMTTLIRYPSNKAGESYTVPDSVTTIGEWAFGGCENLKTVTMKSNMTTIGRAAFRDCSGLTGMTIPEGITELPWGVLASCYNLTYIYIPAGVTTIAAVAFYHCSDNLENVYYGGTEGQWKNIAIGDSNSQLLKATVHYNCTGPDLDPAPMTFTTPCGYTVTEVTPRIYAEIGEFDPEVGLAPVLNITDGDRKWGFMNAGGQMVTPFQYSTGTSFAPQFTEGLTEVRREVGKDAKGNPIYKWGYVDATGKEVVPCKYDVAWRFSDGLAAVRIGDDETGKWGYVDATGREVVPCTYKWADSFQNGTAQAGMDDWNCDTIDKTGKVVKTGLYVEPSYENPIHTAFPQYTGVSYPSEGLMAVSTGDYGGAKWGYINEAGQEVIPLRYDFAWDFQDGLAKVSLDEKYGVIDKTGREVVPCRYDRLEISQDLVKVMLNGKWGLLDKTGREIVPCKYDNYDAPHFAEGLAKVGVVNGKGQWGIQYRDYGFIDAAGREVISCKYNETTDFVNGLAAVKWDTGALDVDGHMVFKWGFIDKSGQEVVPCTLDYEDIRPYTGNLWIVYKGNLLEGLISVTPNATTAYSSTQTVNVDGTPVEFQCYALKDEAGNMTNYIKLRDLAMLLKDTPARFAVGWDGSVTITTGLPYTANGTELSTPYSGSRTYSEATSATKVNGQTADLSAFVLNDDNGGGYTYYQLRDLGKTLGFNVGWSGDKGIFVETHKPYDPAN